MTKKKRAVTVSDCIADACDLQNKLQALYTIKPESSLYSNIVTLDEMIRNLTSLNK
jgi:hypothetical protein